jgi:hypothetical protein
VSAVIASGTILYGIMREHKKILADDRNFNNANDGSLFYHIPSYRVHSNYDCELIKVFLKWMFVL